VPAGLVADDVGAVEEGAVDEGAVLADADGDGVA
jgi:hypothetical protein